MHAFFAASFFLHDVFHPLNGRGYQFWSGIAGSFILGGGIWTSAYVLYRKHNCHARRCLRIGKHPAADGKYVLCPKHHPDIRGTKAPQAEQIHEEHSLKQRYAHGKISLGEFERGIEHVLHREQERDKEKLGA